MATEYNTISMSIIKEEEVKPPEDVLMKLVGPMGKWQIWLCSILCLVKFPSAWHQLAIMFLAPTIAFQCVDTQSNTSSNSEFDSTCIVNCSEYEYDQSVFENTIISEWSLICERGWLKNFNQTVFMFGLLLGSSAFGFLADRFGRRKPFLASVILLMSFGTASAFSPNFTTFMITRFIVGFANGGTMGISFVMCMEIVGSHYREAVGSLYQIPFILGNVTISGFAYYLRTWDSYSLGISVPTVIFLAYFCLLPESPRWLIANGISEEAAKIMKQAAKCNNFPTDSIDETVKKMIKDKGTSTNETHQTNFADLFRHPVLRKKTLACCVIWLAVGLCFYGVSQYISQTSSNIFISVSAAGAIQVPGNLLAIYFNKTFGRKKTIIVSFVLSSICMFIMAYLPLVDWLNLSISCLSVCCIGISFGSVYIYSSELFPTVVRNMGMGLSTTTSKIGSMAAPFIAGLSSTAGWLPPTIFGTVALLAAITCLILPETRGRKLPDSLEDDEHN